MDKDEMKQAIEEHEQEKLAAMEKNAQKRSDAIELGVRAYVKKAEEAGGKEWSEEEKDLLLQTAAEIDAAG